MGIFELLMLALSLSTSIFNLSTAQFHGNNDEDEVNLSAYFHHSLDRIDLNFSITTSLNINFLHPNLSECVNFSYNATPPNSPNIDVIHVRDGTGDSRYCSANTTNSMIIGEIATLTVNNSMSIKVKRSNSGTKYIVNIACLDDLSSSYWNKTETDQLTILIAAEDLGWHVEQNGDQHIMGQLVCSVMTNRSGLRTHHDGTTHQGIVQTTTDVSKLSLDVINDYKVIIGGSVAGGTVVIFIVVLLVVFALRRKRRELCNSPQPDVNIAENQFYSCNQPVAGSIPAYGADCYEEVDHNTSDYYSVCQEPSLYHILENPNSTTYQTEERGKITPANQELYAEIVCASISTSNILADLDHAQEVTLVENELYHSRNTLPTE